MKKVFVFFISLLLLSFSLSLKNSGIIVLMKMRFGSKDFIDLVERSLQFFDFITWLIFITIAIPVNVNKSSKVLSALFFIIYLITIFISFQRFDTNVYVGSVVGIIALLIYYQMVNRYNFTKKMKDGLIIEMAPTKIIFQTALYIFIFSCVFIFSVIASIFSLTMLIDAPIWTILIILPFSELLVWGMLVAVFKSFGEYLIIVLFYLTALPGIFSSGIGYFRGTANAFIVFFAIRVFTVSSLQFQNHISRFFQAAYARRKNDFNYNEVKYTIYENLNLVKTENGDKIACPRCLGKGHVDEEDILRLKRSDQWVPGPCAYCEGLGKINSELTMKIDPDDSQLTLGLSFEEREKYRNRN